MTLRDDLIPVVDEIRGIPDTLGLRVRGAVVVQTITRTGAGLAETEAVTSLTLTPTPRVNLLPQFKMQTDGRYQAGDIVVSRISASYTEAQLNPGGNAVYVIGGKRHRVVTCGPDRAFGWRVVVRPEERGT